MQDLNILQMAISYSLFKTSAVKHHLNHLKLKVNSKSDFIF